MKNKLLIPALILAFILGLFVNDFVCNNRETIVKKKSVRKQWTRTKPLAHTIHFGDTTYIKTYFPDTVWQVIKETDTIYKTLQDYFAYVNVKDTIDLDSVGKVYLNDTLHQNRIIHRDYTADVNYYTKTIHDKSNFKLFVGAFYLNQQNSVGISADIQHKKNVFGGAVGSNKTYMINYKRELWKK